jgi:hypothetical protein
MIEKSRWREITRADDRQSESGELVDRVRREMKVHKCKLIEHVGYKKFLCGWKAQMR